MFSYYGSKSKIVDLYPKPMYDKIIEPFAGSARYSLKWFERDVLLVDKYEVIVRIWKYLQMCSKNDILTLPEPKIGETINRDDFDCIEQAWVMGFIVQDGVSSPRLTVSKFAYKNIKRKKLNIVNNLFKIKHWNIIQGSYDDLQNEECTWFIDPPYQFGGEHYIKSNNDICFKSLCDWCISRKGQSIVCENTKANWMPFMPMKQIQGVNLKKSTEAIWSNIPTAFDWQQQKLF